MKNSLAKNGLIFLIIILFIFSSIIPMVIGYKVVTTEDDSELERMLDNLRFMCTDTNGFSEKRYEYYKEVLLKQYSSDNSNDDLVIESEQDESKILVELPSNRVSIGPIDSAWPMQSHDLHHTGRSPYSTAHIDGLEKWRFEADSVETTPVIDNDGTVYFGGGYEDLNRYLIAIFPDGALKWRFKTGGLIAGSSPAINKDEIIYIGSWDTKLYAINPDGTEKWKIGTGGSIFSSPAIAEDGTIYFGTMSTGNSLVAMNPNGTIKWSYKTGDAVTSSPSIAEDGTVYIGSLDNYLYALYPNGTLRWRYKTGDEIHGHPSIAEDGTIYIGSFDDYLYALFPNNGSMKWKFHTGWGTSGNPSIDDDGTIYVGTDKLYAIYPNGTLKWSFNLGSERWVGHSSPAISADGTIYVGTHIGNGAGGEVIAVNPDGTERWRKKIADEWVDSSPSIAEDGTVYIGSSSLVAGISFGYLHAFGPVESNEPPKAPTISGETYGRAGKEYWYGISAVDPDNNPVSFYIEWGDDTHTGWTGEHASGELYYYEHTWFEQDEYTIRCKAKDVMGEESGWAELTVTMPRNRAPFYRPFLNFLQQYSHKFPILWHTLGL